MVEVNLWAGLRRFTDSKLVVEVEADTVGQMLDNLAETYPGLGTILSDVSVAIDGEITTGGRQTKISSENEIYLMQRMKGG